MTKSSTGDGQTQTFAVGRECEAWCVRCKETTYHTVVAMLGDRPKQVACGGCNDWHAYSKPRDVVEPPPPVRARRGAVEATGPRRGRAKAPRLSPTSALEMWQAAVDAAGGSPLIYDHRDSYAVGDVVQHPTHGVCVVTSTETPKRALVLSRDGERAILTSGVRTGRR